MNLRIFFFLLSAALVIVLSACSTTGTGPGGVPPSERDSPTKTDSGDKSRQSHQPDLHRHPSERGLLEAKELSLSMTGYQSDVALEIVRSLESIPSGQLITMIDNQLYDPEFTEWIELALQIRMALINGNPIPEAARYWVDYHYGHVITAANFTELVYRYRALFPVPSQVAILLPRKGGLSAAARAIRDGILSAYLEQPGESVIRFYSSGENSDSAIAAYNKAREDGAMHVIGPLRIDSTRALASVDNLTVPVLLLNEPATTISFFPEQTPLVNSLTLSQTGEAAAIAARALTLGQKRALVLVPNTGWGARIEAAFKTAFEQGEGEISATSRFNRTTNDHSAMLTQLLRIDESKQRKADLQFLLGVPLTFEPNRRDDFDFIFLAANAKEGRELKPLLRFHDAGGVPVYAMGRIFSGKVERASDQDLDDIVFPTTPWQLNMAGESIIMPASVRDGAYGNLFALGQDAWRLLPWLPLMQKDPDLWFSGHTGSLRLQTDGRLYREPAWARFSAGRPVPYQWPINY